MLHHGLADRFRAHLVLAETFELAHDLRHHLLDSLGIHRSFAQRDLHRSHQLVAIEWHAPSVALDDDELAQLHALEGGEAEIAGEAHPPAADGGGILGRTRILDLGIEAPAIRTAHGPNSGVVDREASNEPLHLVPDRGLDYGVLARSFPRERIEHLGNHLPDLL